MDVHDRTPLLKVVVVGLTSGANFVSLCAALLDKHAYMIQTLIWARSVPATERDRAVYFHKRLEEAARPWRAEKTPIHRFGQPYPRSRAMMLPKTHPQP